MFTKSVQIILSRAMSDAEFAKLLILHPEQALAGYTLSAEELAVFNELTLADFAPRPPEHRKSFSLANPAIQEHSKKPC
jgi:hypothetical protein